MKVLVTGAAGFIGHHVARRLAETRRCEVLGVDNLSDYYDVALKRARLEQLAPLEDFRFLQADFADAAKFPALVAHFKPDYVVHLGAQPGVRFSMEQPAAYTRNNLEGFATVLEACRRNPPRHLVFASSSSVYGAGAKPPFREDDDANRPVSYYGATKRANELMAYSYAHNHRLNVTGLRFFTVYGPWGRPDMAPTLFARAILAGEPLKLFNGGRNLRDFTYVDDIVDGVKAGFLTIERIEQWAAGEGIDAERQRWLEQVIHAIRADRLENVFSQRIGAFITACRLRERKNFMSGATHRYRFELVVAPAVEREAAFYKKMANDIIFESPQLQQMEHKARRVLFQLWESCWRNYVDRGPRVINILPPRVGRLIDAAEGEAAKARRICDWLAGLTDGMIVRTYRRLFDPEFGSLRDLS